MKKSTYRISLSLIALIIIGIGLFFYLRPRPRQTVNTAPSTNSNNGQGGQEAKKEIYDPIEFAKARITRKPFGIYVSPKNSPVQPERFTGYHTGTDFEVTPDELTKDIQDFAACDGKILEKGIVSGYGGVIIQSCTLSGEPVTVLYGHINISKSTYNIGDTVRGGSPLAFLGDDKSFYTDGERKHLHVGVRKGEAIDYRGYVSSRSELANWIDIEPYLP